MDIIEKALRVAVSAHKEQVRKTDGSPYVVHPIMVGNILRAYGCSDVVVASGIVHDVLEDTDVREEELERLLGEEVLTIVKAVSEDKQLPWETRKETYVENVSNASVEVKAISVADKIHNGRSLIEYHGEVGSEAWKRFGKSKDKKMWFEHLLLDSLRVSFEHPLLDEYENVVAQLDALSD
jgi:(p)ppGpp synthase/HD superfamily hydrolase